MQGAQVWSLVRALDPTSCNEDMAQTKKCILQNKTVQERSFSQTPLMEGSLTLPRASSQVLVRVLLPEGTVRQARAHPDSIISPESTGPTGTPGCSPPGLPDLPCTGPSAAPGMVSHPSWIPPPLDSTPEQSGVGGTED